MQERGVADAPLRVVKKIRLVECGTPRAELGCEGKRGTTPLCVCSRIAKVKVSLQYVYSLYYWGHSQYC